MYNGFYSFKESPFSLSPDPSYIYMTEHHREAMAGLIHGVCSRPGLTVLVGEAGTGKTTLLYMLMGWLEKRRYVPALCTNPTLTREELYDLLLTQFGVECPSSLKSRQLLALERTLTRHRLDGRPAILILDEAQRLSGELLEEVRLLLNLETPREKLLEIILSGQPELEDTLRCPALRQFKQRVSTICKLRTLTLDEAGEYVNHRLTLAGVPNQTIFPTETIALIHQLSGGIPRLINSLCNSSLQIGFAMECHRLSVPIVREAASDLDLNPNELISEPPTPPPAEVVTKPATKAVSSNVNAQNGSAQNGSAQNGSAQNGRHERMPLDNYATRQQHLSFLASFLDRWR